MIKIFDCKKLSKLYKRGRLDPILQKFPNQINQKTWIGSGSEAAAFYSDQQVIKVCPKRIRFFEEAGHSSAERFQNQVNQLQPFLVPINDILYEDRHVLVYTQDQCKLLKNTDYKSDYVALSFLQLIIFMLENNQLVSDIGVHNLGLLYGHVVVFDYHGLHPITINGRVCHRKWWKRPITNLSNFLSYVDYKGKGFSSHYNQFLKGLLVCRKEKDLIELIKLLYKCLDIMMNSVRLTDHQWKKIRRRNEFLQGPPDSSLEKSLAESVSACPSDKRGSKGLPPESRADAKNTVPKEKRAPDSFLGKSLAETNSEIHSEEESSHSENESEDNISQIHADETNDDSVKKIASVPTELDGSTENSHKEIIFNDVQKETIILSNEKENNT